ncbi:DNA topoisomerase [Alishewanella agri BL06]|uniref:DNA topoisomerase n=1 Tax=Alishewanella agri BL06 TaxID=1195246 RepID=I8U597_9ALTE|nr:topoisomerase DNA-binding C4 zinc finger domain-containing protein [Alishewanella agri]EIW88496.1 DNA topoisomerase [Alishewanella agri BL06]
MSDHNPLFQLPQHAEPCPQCGQPLVIRSGKSGPFLGCSSYPACDYLKPLHQHDNTVVKILEDEPCPECAAPLAVKHGRYGMFIGCTRYPDCHFVVHEEASASSSIACPQCQQGQLTERLSKFGKTFWGCNRYPDCRFLVNDAPQLGTCQFCQFPLLLQKKSGLYCAAKGCQKKQPAKAG